MLHAAVGLSAGGVSQVWAEKQQPPQITVFVVEYNPSCYLKAAQRFGVAVYVWNKGHNIA